MIGLKIPQKYECTGCDFICFLPHTDEQAICLLFDDDIRPSHLEWERAREEKRAPTLSPCTRCRIMRGNLSPHAERFLNDPEFNPFPND